MPDAAPVIVLVVLVAAGVYLYRNRGWERGQF